MFVYYLVLQDRIKDAIKIFDSLSIPQDGDKFKIQHDYLSAYFDFFTGSEAGYKTARRIVQEYSDFPILDWKKMFLAIEDQLNEYDNEFDQLGEAANDPNLLAVSNASQTETSQKKTVNKRAAKKSEPNITHFAFDNDGTLNLETVNIKSVTIKYYLIDAELLFSKSPFLTTNAEQFSYVAPFQQVKVEIHPETATEQQLVATSAKKIPLPDSLKEMNANTVVEINAGEIQKFIPFYQIKLKVNIMQTLGELKVCDLQNKPLPRVYVKVYARHVFSGKDFFFRDGYTDIRGKLDYTQTAGDKMKYVQKFSIMVISETLGSKIQEVDPPQGAVQLQTDKDKKQVKPFDPMADLYSRKMEHMQMRQSKIKMSKKR